MKALIVLEDKEKLSLLKKKLTNAGFDTICYQWLMKALDNLEEISPHLVIISAEDYPRHWKVFVQHVKANFSDNQTEIYLLASSKDSVESDKVKILGIKDVIYDFESDLQKLISSWIPDPEEIAVQVVSPEPAESAVQVPSPEPADTAVQVDSPEPAHSAVQVASPEPADTAVQVASTELALTAAQVPTPEPAHTAAHSQKPVVSSCNFIITNPVTNRAIPGRVRKYKYPTIIFIPNNKEDVKALRFGQVFENCILKQVVNNKELSCNHRCQIRGISDDSIEFCLLR